MRETGGDPGASYQAARTGLAIRDRSSRARLLVEGRAPILALRGVLTGRMPDAPNALEGLARARVEYSAVLTPKGRMIADLGVMWGPDPEQEGLLLDVPAAAIGPLLEHLKRLVPPRLATVVDVSDDSWLATVLGPEAPDAIAEIAFGSESYASEIEGLAEGEFLQSPEEERRGGHVGTDAIRVARSGEVDTSAWDLFVPAARFNDVWDRMTRAGAVAMSAHTWDVLRVEAGRPAYGVDMDQSTLLSETGLVDRAVDHTKGCYTGQEIIVRIRDRGHVNRSLRGLIFEVGHVPKPGSDLFRDDGAVGGITSVVESPRLNATIGLGYVHRKVAHGELVSVGSAAGPGAEVRSLGVGWSTE
jgi:folate-binding protein YgfZ